MFTVYSVCMEVHWECFYRKLKLWKTYDPGLLDCNDTQERNEENESLINLNSLEMKVIGLRENPLKGSRVAEQQHRSGFDSQLSVQNLHVLFMLVWISSHISKTCKSCRLDTLKPLILVIHNSVCDSQSLCIFSVHEGIGSRHP